MGGGSVRIGLAEAGLGRRSAPVKPGLAVTRMRPHSTETAGKNGRSTAGATISDGKFCCEVPGAVFGDPGCILHHTPRGRGPPGQPGVDQRVRSRPRPCGSRVVGWGQSLGPGHRPSRPAGPRAAPCDYRNADAIIRNWGQEGRPTPYPSGRGVGVTAAAGAGWSVGQPGPPGGGVP